MGIEHFVEMGIDSNLYQILMVIRGFLIIFLFSGGQCFARICASGLTPLWVYELWRPWKLCAYKEYGWSRKLVFCTV